MIIKDSSIRLLVFGIIGIALVVAYIILVQTGASTFLENGDMLIPWIQQFGQIGPLVIIGLMTLAIIISPIPSAPIALAAGAAYGHTAGTIYVVIGSELGAIIAFFIARLLGIEVMQKWFGHNLEKGLLGSQNMLMGIVFVSRLLPFLSFDIVSYAAGVTTLSLWRFVLATFAGILPASFLLAHFGSELVSGESQRIGLTLLGLGVISLLLLLSKWAFNRK